NFLFPSRLGKSPHIGTRQYARIVDRWVEEIGLDPAAYGTHSMRRDQGVSNLPTHKKSQGSTASPWAHEAGEHGPILSTVVHKSPHVFFGGSGGRDGAGDLSPG